MTHPARARKKHFAKRIQQELAQKNLQKLKQLEKRISECQKEIEEMLQPPQNSEEAKRQPPIEIRLHGLTASENIRLNAILNPDCPQTIRSLSVVGEKKHEGRRLG
ncbi:hypothetical protein [Aliikangiella coralliicola]|uniref:Uncharacterized protein n=1 Tax=Aliikangiella coralliicola TaxID=2592383 RepID=A0A545UCD2_9GAMM|nr:hypothetical protein [Aliikangiella coralliicola]TQV87124.1 hypothetical protein FLL46_15070 [Aliikangiella coralliicola]